jgi:A/G-specific adenine glycosylase
LRTFRDRTRLHSIVRPLRAWYARKGRTLPWRDIGNEYNVLVSEIMLQQTQVSRVLVMYPLFLRKFPTMAALARARRSDVVVAWKGLGYNNRAVRLHELSKVVVARHQGHLPATEEALRALPGIGKYTAHAILSSVHHQRVPLVDVNVRRVFSRYFWRMPYWHSMRPEKEIWGVAESVLPARSTYAWHQGLMDLGATVCTARKPGCTACPLRAGCCSAGVLRGPFRERAVRERRYRGIPNRIYRGKIVDTLRTKKSLTAPRIGERILPGFSRQDHGWLMTLLEALRKDGLVVLSVGNDATTCTVSLA